MLTEPSDLDRSDIRQGLERGFRIHDPELDHLPVGFGSHHWRAVDARGTRWFVTVDDLRAGFRTAADADTAFAGLGRAFSAAAALRDVAGLRFVAAPLIGRDGAVIRRLTERYAMTVSPFIDGASAPFAPYERPEERTIMGAMLGRLHAATPRIPGGLARREDFAVPARAELVDALHDLDRPWDGGPFAEPARELLRARADGLELRLREYDELAAAVRAHSGAWVITHGEPHRGNVVRDNEGGMHLVDWDTTLTAPRERDLHFVLDDDLTGLEAYRDAAGGDALDHDALRLYRSWWDLADIAVFVAEFRRPHRLTADTAKGWDVLAANLGP